mgnify:CR=1 FL=1|jgi:arylsulfatase A-like enzyme
MYSGLFSSGYPSIALNITIMNRKIFISELALLSIGIASAHAQSATEAVKPNVLFILADDLGWMDLGCYGSSFYETPNIDQLSKEGVRFTNAYAACPVSSPTRASFQTGKYPARLHLTDYIPGGYSVPSRKEIIDATCPVLPVDFVQNMPLSEFTIAEALRLEGYRTAHVGKWNCSVDSLTYPQYQGYDINIAGCNKGGPGKDGYFSPYHNPYLTDGPKGEYLTDRLGDECIKILRNFKDKPFFINLPFYQVHTPLLAKPEKVKYFEEKARKMGLLSLETFDTNPEWKRKQPYQDSTRMERILQSNAIYAAMIASMDENVGRIIDELKRLGLYENTIIIFTSDNGGLATSEGSPTSNRPLRGGKGFTYEGGIREPLIVRMSDMKGAGSSCDSIVTSTDYYPTILEMTGSKLRPEQHLDGISLLPLLEGKQRVHRDAVYWHYPHYSNQGGRPSGAVRMGNYKLIQFYDTGEIELYDLPADLSEQNNLKMEKPEIAQKLLQMLDDWRKSVDADMPVKNARVND